MNNSRVRIPFGTVTDDAIMNRVSKEAVKSSSLQFYNIPDNAFSTMYFQHMLINFQEVYVGMVWLVSLLKLYRFTIQTVPMTPWRPGTSGWLHVHLCAFVLISPRYIDSGLNMGNEYVYA